MAEISFSVAELFSQVFGYNSGAFEQDLERQLDKIPERTRTSAKGSPYYGVANGREYYMPVKLKYTTEGSSDVKEYSLPYPVISSNTRKRIVETALVERQGVVKELINIEDWEFTIRGIIVGKDNEYPEQQVDQLIAVYEQNKAIEIHSAITDLLLIRKNNTPMVVIRELSFPEVKGITNARGYELKLISDMPFDLSEIKK